MSTVPKWQPGTLYIKGDLVQPLTAIAATPASLTNANFDSGDTGWTKDAVWTIVTGETFTGSYSAKFSGSPSAQGVIVNDDRIAITPGEAVGASCMVNQGASSANDAGAVVRVYWYDAGGSAITPAYTEGTYVKSGSNGEWKRSSVTAVAPAGAAKFSLGARAYHDGSGQDLWVDSFTLDYTPRSAPEGLIYRAVQDDPGTSDSTEPTWPTTLGVQVIDNTVTWEAVYATRVTWEASPIMESGATEPDWPTTPGAMIVDGTVLWECFTRRVEDENCPNSKVVAIAASKVYAADDDIIRYSATINPLDWTSENDAGYLPYGLQTYGANPVAAMGLYRGNLVAFNTEGCQIWQVDEDPALSTLLDALPLGSSRHRALAPVNNDLFLLSSLGVRSISIAGGSTNLAAGDVGMPVDSLVVAAVEAMARALPLATYSPGAGQYWLAVAQEPLHDIAITGDLPDGYIGDSGTYRYQILGGEAPVTVEVTAGALPDGASIDDDGKVTYQYTVAGTFSWTLTATGADGNSDTVEDTAVVAAEVFPSTRNTWFAQPTTGRMGHMVATNADALAIGNAATGITIACLIDAELTTSNPTFYISTGTSTSEYRAAIWSGTNGIITASGQRLDGASGVTVDSADTYIDWLMAIAVFDYANGAVTLHVNGESVGTGSISAGVTSATASERVGMHPEIVNRVRGGDTSVFASALTQTQIDRMFGYMAENWNMRDLLPAEHPYKTASLDGWNPKAEGARIWYYADNEANTFPASDAISVLHDASGNGNDASGFDDGDNQWITLSTELP